ncbi:Mu transposase C-terminal domain-containing protein [bacterium]|nr:Mu transposase C-terminal domain-containing protein [bacterium]
MTLVVDCGTEFGSRHFEMFLASNRINKKQRPLSKARFGSLIERFFGMSNELFVHNLIGNTQLMKNVRQISRSTNPKMLAAWTISKLGDAFAKWVVFYNNRNHGTLLTSPNEAYGLGMQKQPVPFRRIEYDQNFLIDSMPSPRTGKAKVDGCRGIKVNYLYYWSNKLALPSVAGTHVEVRYDPFNAGITYAFINGQWEPCYARSHYHQLKNCTEAELKYASAEIRKRYRNHGRRHVPNAAEFAHFFEEIQQIEQEEIEIRQQRSAEMKKRHRSLDAPEKPDTRDAFDIDVGSLKVLNWRKAR